MSEGKMSAEELAQAREVARKPHRFESAHPTKWSDLTERLLAHIEALKREMQECCDDEAEALAKLATLQREADEANEKVLYLAKIRDDQSDLIQRLQREADGMREALDAHRYFWQSRTHPHQEDLRWGVLMDLTMSALNGSPEDRSSEDTNG